MTYSIFDSTGNIIDAFIERAAAPDCLAGIAQAEPESAAEVFLTAQDSDGHTVGDTVVRVIGFRPSVKAVCWRHLQTSRPRDGHPPVMMI